MSYSNHTPTHEALKYKRCSYFQKIVNKAKRGNWSKVVNMFDSMHKNARSQFLNNWLNSTPIHEQIANKLLNHGGKS